MAMVRECRNCRKEFEPRLNWQRYCRMQCRLLARRFIARLRFGRHRIWEAVPQPSAYELEMAWYERFRRQRRRTWILVALAVLISGCVKTPQPRAEIPDPPANQKVWLAFDGQKLVWMPLTGGPSGAIDATSHFGEIELVNEATAKYIRSPVTYAKQPVAGQLAVYGPPGASEQAIQASGMSAKLLGIERGVLIEGKVDQPEPTPPEPAPSVPGRAILGWTNDTYVAAGKKFYVSWGSMGHAGAPNRVFAMPVSGRLTRLMVATRSTQPSTGALEFRISKSGVAQAGLEVILLAGAAAGVFAADGSVDVAANDLVQVEITNHAAANSAYINAITAVFEYAP
jgi:hypothetical protein